MTLENAEHQDAAAQRNADRQRVWFVTGTSSGFGLELVKELIARGEKVVATARNVDKIAQWKHTPNVLILPVDVTDHEQIQQAVQQTVDTWGRIDVLVNNAGWGYFGSVEEADEAEVRRLFEANFWGLAAVTRAVLPVLRRQRSGRILNITSVAGLLGSPGVGYYNASKHAVEGLMKALSKEVAPLGIKVTDVEPGPFRTDWAGRSHVSAAETITDYDQTAHTNAEHIEGYSGKQQGSPELLAKALVKLSGLADPPLHFVAGSDALARANQELANEKRDIDLLAEDSKHLFYGDEDYWRE